jgi:hypothetical protein
MMCTGHRAACNTRHVAAWVGGRRCLTRTCRATRSTSGRRCTCSQHRPHGLTRVYASGVSFVALFPQSLGASRALCYVRRALYLARNSADPPPAAQIVRFASLCTTHSLAAPAMPGPALAERAAAMPADARRFGGWAPVRSFCETLWSFGSVYRYSWPMSSRPLIVFRSCGPLRL